MISSDFQVAGSTVSELMFPFLRGRGDSHDINEYQKGRFMESLTGDNPITYRFLGLNPLKRSSTVRDAEMSTAHQPRLDQYVDRTCKTEIPNPQVTSEIGNLWLILPDDCRVGYLTDR